MTLYKVAKAGGGWKYGFTNLKAASAYANRMFMLTGVVVAVEAYTVPKGGA